MKRDFDDSEMTGDTSPDAVPGHDQMRDRLSPSRDSNNIKYDPIATNRRLHQEADGVGNGNTSNTASDDGAADTRK